MARSVINFNNNNLTKKKNCTSHVYQQTLAYRIKHAKKKNHVTDIFTWRLGTEE